MARHRRPAGVELGADRDVAGEFAGHRLAQHGRVWPRLPAPGLPRLGHLPRRHDRHHPDRALGDGAFGGARRAVCDPELVEPHAAMGGAAGAPPDGRVSRDQRDRLRAAVRGGRRARAIRRRDGAVRAQYRRVLQALFRGGGGDRPAAGGRHPRDRSLAVAGDHLRGDPAGHSAVELVRALSARDQCALGDDARHRRRRRHRPDVVREHSLISLRRHRGADDHRGRRSRHHRHDQRQASSRAGVTVLPILIFSRLISDSIFVGYQYIDTRRGSERPCMAAASPIDCCGTSILRE